MLLKAWCFTPSGRYSFNRLSAVFHKQIVSRAPGKNSGFPYSGSSFDHRLQYIDHSLCLPQWIGNPCHQPLRSSRSGGMKPTKNLPDSPRIAVLISSWNKAESSAEQVSRRFQASTAYAGATIVLKERDSMLTVRFGIIGSSHQKQS